MTNETRYATFSQRNGFEPMPTQFVLGVVPPQLRRLLQLAFTREIDRNSYRTYNGQYFKPNWITVAEDFHVKLLKKSPISSANRPHELSPLILQSVGRLPLPDLSDLTEFFIRNRGCSDDFKSDIREAFEASRSAYRVIDNKIVAIGNDEEADAFVAALAATETASADGARKHLINAGQDLKAAKWADSVRESIHAVESVARGISGKKKLSDALTDLEKSHGIHPALKGGFDKLYGYTSDSQGVRHPLIDDATAKVDETDALFMLGACASFVSYLLARHRQAAEKGTL